MLVTFYMSLAEPTAGLVHELSYCMDNRAENNSQLSKGAIAGIVVGILAFITIKSGRPDLILNFREHLESRQLCLSTLSELCLDAVIVYWVCRAKRRRISRQPARRLSRDEETRAFLRQLKAHEFACHDTKYGPLPLQKCSGHGLSESLRCTETTLHCKLLCHIIHGVSHDLQAVFTAGYSF